MVTFLETSVCMFAINNQEFHAVPVYNPKTSIEPPVKLMREDGCSFLITTAVELPGGFYRVCVQANDQISSQSWQVYNDIPGPANPPVATGTQPSECWDFPTNSNLIVTVVHNILDNQGVVIATCTTNLLIASSSYCEEDVVTASVGNCQLQTDINIDVEAINIPYVISFGDGSLAVQSSSGEITHTYGQTGTYQICLTYIYEYNEINTYITCCYPIQVDLPQYCTCPEDIVSLVSVEPCTWVAEMNFELDVEDFPITVDYGDGTTPEVVTGPTATHDFPDNGVYQVCYTFEPEPGHILECCEWIVIPGCCLDASFTLEPDYANGWESCINPVYIVTPTACLGSALEVTHIWEFSDGTVFNGPFPPPHIFTNFVDANGKVCVTHTIICCDESVSETVCEDHIPGAYLGTAGGQLELDDILPSTGQTVLQFIQQTANGPLPLLIDGLLIVNINSEFTGGIWNMGRNSEILVRGTTSLPRRLFSLNGTTIRSAVRIPNFPACCRWEGIRSERLTTIRTASATVMDANYAIHYPSLTVGTPFPQIYSVNSTFENNYYVIRSNRQHVHFSRFHGNTLNGTTLDPHVCGCTAVNAIDFRDAGTGSALTVSIDNFGFADNEIFNYEQGFNFHNTRLISRGFDIHDLREYDDSPGVPNNLAGEAAIGIDFSWTLATNSRLEIDRISFTDFVESDALSYAVRDRVTRGLHTLRALASTQGSINTSGIAGGYDLNITSPARLDFGSIISLNTIETDGSNNIGQGFGITGNFTASNNDLRIAENQITVSTGGNNPLNGGIILNSTEDLNQSFGIEFNEINLGLTNGVGIAVIGARGYCVRRNWIGNPSDATGILLSGGGGAMVECNEVLEKPTGIQATWSDVNTYSGNYLSLNENDMHFTGDCRGATRSTIQWNTFDFSSQPSLIYDVNAFTGAQTHNNYNSWTGQANQGGGNVEVQHAAAAGSFQVNQSRFNRPSLAALGTIHFPNHIPPGTGGMFAAAPNNNITNIPSTFCNSTNGCFAMLQGPDSGDDYEALVQDAGAWSGLTAAEQTFLRQGIYGLLLENPSWLSGSSTLSGFKAAHDAGFVGQSETLRHDWQQLMEDISAHQATLQPIYDSLNVLADQLQQWFDAIAADSSLEASLQGQIDAAIQQGAALAAQLQQAEDQFDPTVQAAIAQLLAQNASLSGAGQYEWKEKRYNEIALNWLAGTEPDATAADDLRSIAQTCLTEGGRAVLDARGLCAVWLKEYYDEGNCTSLQPRSSGDGANVRTEANPDLRIVPNPADNMVWIDLQGGTDESQQVQVFSMDGRQVFSGKMPSTGSLAIPVKGWPEGLYVAKMIANNKIISKTFVVQHR